MKPEIVRHSVKAFWTEEGGVTAIEYALLAALIFLVIVAAVGTVGGEVQKLFEKIAAIFPLVP